MLRHDHSGLRRHAVLLRRHAVLAALVGAVLLASACASEDGNGATAATTAEVGAQEPAPTAAPDTTTGTSSDAEGSTDAGDADDSGSTDDGDGDGDEAETSASEADDGAEDLPPPAGPLGQIVVAPGDAVRIGSVSVIIEGTPGARDYGDIAKLAIEHFGPVHGRFEVDVGTPLSDPCSAAASPLIAAYVEANADLVGIVGPSCSATATGIGQSFSEAGIAIVSPTNTSPLLTSDLAGNAGEHNHPGYFRTAHNDLYAGAAVAAFLHERFDAGRVAVVHQGDAYTLGLSQAFRTAYEHEGGTVSDFVQLDVDTTDIAEPGQISEALDRIAPSDPDVLFFVLYSESAEVFLQVYGEHDGFDGTVLVGGDTVRSASLMALEPARGMFISGPQIDFAGNVNQATGRSVDEVAEQFAAAVGTPPSRAFWPHAYDAATLLLEAIEAASRVDGDTLVIDRAAVRDHLSQVEGFAGLSGTLTCDPFGDCGAGVVTIIEHLDPADVESSFANVVYRYSHNQSS